MKDSKFSYDKVLKWNDVSLIDLLGKYGSPLYVMNANQIKDNISMIKKSVEAYFKNVKILYA